MTTLAAYAFAAVLEIAGCYAVWAVVRLGKPVWWVLPGLAALAAFAWFLTRVDGAYAGRAYAAYGGIYIVFSLGWLWFAEGVRPDRWDITGATLCLAGAFVILGAPR